jgi:hypothetical protein
MPWHIPNYFPDIVILRAVFTVSSSDLFAMSLLNCEPAAPGATPQSVGNSYTTATGTARDAESAVVSVILRHMKRRPLTRPQWTYNPSTQQLSPQWINSDGSAWLPLSLPLRILDCCLAPANTVSFTQSTALYVGGDSSAFVSRYPSPIILIVSLWPSSSRVVAYVFCRTINLFLSDRAADPPGDLS